MLQRIGGLIVVLFLLFQGEIKAQESVLDEYIQEALKSNLVIQQKQVSLDNAMLALKKAKYNYLPTLNFEGLYTTAEGGRSYAIPVGDYLNPLLGTVNQFLGPLSIPLLENEKINFLPKNYYDAKVRLAVPIINTDIINSNRIQTKQQTISEKELEIYARELIQEVKQTYYAYLSLENAIAIHQKAIELAEESKRVNEKLVENGKGVYAYVLRSETEMEQLKAQKQAAELQLSSVQYYFNALLNRELDAAIKRSEITENIPVLDASQVGANRREELLALEQLIGIREDVVRMNQQSFIPTLSGFADFGSQAEDMRFEREALYYMVGLQLNIPIFNGFKKNIDLKRAKNEVDWAKLQRDEIAQKLNVAAQSAYHDAAAELSNYQATLKQLEMAETYHRLIQKGYASGVNTYIETVDARTQLTLAKLGANVNYYKYLSALAKLERETSSYILPTFEK